MPKNNNLQDYLQDLYEGIKSRKPDASKNPQDFRREIENLAKTDDADALAADIRLGKTAYVDNEKITGTIEDYDGSVILDGEVYNFDYTKPYIFKVEEVYSDATTPATIYCIPQETGSVRFYPVANEDLFGTDIKNYVYRFYVSIPSGGGEVSVYAVRNDRGNTSTLGECIWAAGKVNTIVPTTTSGSMVDSWTSSEKAAFVSAAGLHDNPNLYTYSLTEGAYFIEVKLADIYDNRGVRFADIVLSIL